MNTEDKELMFYGILFNLILFSIPILILVYHFRQYKKRTEKQNKVEYEQLLLQRKLTREKAIKDRRNKLYFEQQNKEELKKKLEEENARRIFLEQRESDRVRCAKILAESKNRIYKKADIEYISNGEYKIRDTVFMSIWAFKCKHDITPNETDINHSESQFHASSASEHYSCVPDFGNYDTVKIFPYGELYRHYFEVLV